MQFYYGAQSDGSVGLVHKFIKKRTFKYQTEIWNVISVWSLQDMNPFQA